MNESEDCTWWVKPISANTIEVGFKVCGAVDTLCMTRERAAVMASAITEAVEEAKKMSDPFERWWGGLLPSDKTAFGDDYRNIAPGLGTDKERARIIWDAARKANP